MIVYAPHLIILLATVAMIVILCVLAKKINESARLLCYEEELLLKTASEESEEDTTKIVYLSASEMNKLVKKGFVKINDYDKVIVLEDVYGDKSRIRSF